MPLVGTVFDIARHAVHAAKFTGDVVKFIILLLLDRHLIYQELLNAHRTSSLWNTQAVGHGVNLDPFTGLGETLGIAEAGILQACCPSCRPITVSIKAVNMTYYEGALSYKVSYCKQIARQHSRLTVLKISSRVVWSQWKISLL